MPSLSPPMMISIETCTTESSTLDDESAGLGTISSGSGSTSVEDTGIRAVLKSFGDNGSDEDSQVGESEIDAFVGEFFMFLRKQRASQRAHGVRSHRPLKLNPSTPRSSKPIKGFSANLIGRHQDSYTIEEASTEDTDSDSISDDTDAQQSQRESVPSNQVTVTTSALGDDEKTESKIPVSVDIKTKCPVTNSLGETGQYDETVSDDVPSPPGLDILETSLSTSESVDEIEQSRVEVIVTTVAEDSSVESQLEDETTGYTQETPSDSLDDEDGLDNQDDAQICHVSPSSDQAIPEDSAGVSHVDKFDPFQLSQKDEETPTPSCDPESPNASSSIEDIMPNVLTSISEEMNSSPRIKKAGSNESGDNNELPTDRVASASQPVDVERNLSVERARRNLDAIAFSTGKQGHKKGLFCRKPRKVSSQIKPLPSRRVTRILSKSKLLLCQKAVLRDDALSVDASAGSENYMAQKMEMNIATSVDHSPTGPAPINKTVSVENSEPSKETEVWPLSPTSCPNPFRPIQASASAVPFSTIFAIQFQPSNIPTQYPKSNTQACSVVQAIPVSPQNDMESPTSDAVACSTTVDLDENEPTLVHEANDQDLAGDDGLQKVMSELCDMFDPFALKSEGEQPTIGSGGSRIVDGSLSIQESSHGLSSTVQPAVSGENEKITSDAPTSADSSVNEDPIRESGSLCLSSPSANEDPIRESGSLSSSPSRDPLDDIDRYTAEQLAFENASEANGGLGVFESTDSEGPAITYVAFLPESCSDLETSNVSVASLSQANSAENLRGKFTSMRAGSTSTMGSSIATEPDMYGIKKTNTAATELTNSTTWSSKERTVRFMDDVHVQLREVSPETVHSFETPSQNRKFSSVLKNWEQRAVNATAPNLVYSQ